MNSKEIIARRIAKMFVDGNVVNLGAGLPVLVNKFLSAEISVVLQAENGIVGSCALQSDCEQDTYVVDAGGAFCAVKLGGAIVDSATSFGLIRGGHLDATVLGAMQVDASGSLANWVVTGGKFTGMGGAMDLVCGAKRVIVATEHCSKDGSPKILSTCTFPLTGYKVVDVIVTELAVIEVTAAGLVMTEIAPGLKPADIQAQTGAALAVSPKLCLMNVN